MFFLKRFPAKWIFADPPPQFILYVGKHVAEIKASEMVPLGCHRILKLKGIGKKGRGPNPVLFSLISDKMDN